ncbi:MAG: hypothetical protein A2W91_16375 [Bacteroidetes bacterium GWF2_38_335]|nr:MAG: hypothetical protein A2W91_16375 [Bacteroidetes bacterium GWF2_38_335]OFY81265.1 MAG: hypothetical protein A2281_07350 [Bacteroidetes bacterium RIFOXYA12_FULL_38_20]HBS85383.1 short-chain dehydrogenase [Bacteroidales bacterium]
MNYIYITGTSRGIGKAFAELLLKRENNFVTGISRTCTIKHPRFRHVKLDLAKVDDVLKFTFENHKDARAVMLVNNSGAIGEVKQMGRLASTSVVETMNINAVSPAILMNEFVKTHEKSDAIKLILNISSGAGRHPIESWSSYCASKSAIDMFSQVLSVEQTNGDPSRHFHIFSVAPGIVDTHMQDEIRKISADDFRNVSTFIGYKEKNMLTTPETVAEKLLELINNPDNYPNVLMDVREM